MKKFRFIGAALAAVMLLSACASGSAEEGGAQRKLPTFSPSGEAVKSSVFGGGVSYDGFTPAENISLPAEISGMAQLETSLYVLSGGSLYRIDLPSGAQEKLFDSDAKMLSACGGALFTYAPESGKLREYSPDGALRSEREILLQSGEVAVGEFFVAESCVDFYCTDSSGAVTKMIHNVFSRQDLQPVCSFEEKSVGMTLPNVVFAQYKGDSILRLSEDLSDSRFASVSETDLKTGKSTKLCSVEKSPNSFSGTRFALAYREKTDTVLVFTAPAAADFRETDFAPTLGEYSLTDPDNVLLARFYPDDPSCENAFVSVYENIVCAAASAGGSPLFYDYLDPPESVTLACSSAGAYSDVIAEFEKTSGITVRTVSYGTDFDRLDIRLMAGDRDIDIYEPVPMHQTKYFISGMFEDLSGYEGLKARLDGNASAGKAAELDGAYIGIPTYTSNFTSRENFEPPEGASEEYAQYPNYSKTVSKYLYLAQNVDLVRGSYDDPNGSKLYKLLKFIHDNPDGSEAKMPFGRELCLLDSGFLVMNPGSGNKDAAAKFLECAFDCFSGVAEGFESRYESALPDGAYVYWRCFSPDYVSPVLSACAKAELSDVRSSELKETAREAASEVRMRILE